jgi:cytidine deaminase
MMNPQNLIEIAIQAAKKGYTPYSSFPVGAVIAMKDGTVVEGANIENSSYGLSMCAERNALFRAHLMGYRANDMLMMAVVGPTEEPISPCGACRQVMAELMHATTPIHLSNLHLSIKSTTVASLLPDAFDGSHLPGQSS